jgi:hypothetical protein
MFKTIARWLLKKELSSLYSVITKQEEEITNLKSLPAPVEQVRLTNRLTSSEYYRFKASLPAAVITSTSTDLQAAALVGQQAVLDRMERELVSG